MRGLKNLVRHVLAGTLFYSGALFLYLRWVLRDRVIVLMYHRVLPREVSRRSFSSPAIVVSPESFAMHMDCVRRWLRPLSIDDSSDLGKRAGAAGARKAGYRLAFTTIRGHHRRGDPPYEIKPINMHEAAAPTQALFLCRVAGLF